VGQCLVLQSEDFLKKNLLSEAGLAVAASGGKL